MFAPQQQDDGDAVVGLRAIAEFATAEGYKVSHSSMQKYCSPAINTGPEIAAFWGRLPVSTKGRIRVWIRWRIRPARVGTPRATVAGHPECNAGSSFR
jgi:hypothetical protein